MTKTDFCKLAKSLIKFKKGTPQIFAEELFPFVPMIADLFFSDRSHRSDRGDQIDLWKPDFSGCLLVVYARPQEF